MWLAAGLLVGFAVPLVFSDLLTLPRDLYYAIYAVVAIGFFVLWSRSTQQSLAAMMRRRWVLAVVLGLVGSCPGQCPTVTLRPIASPTARNHSIGSNPDGLSGAKGKTAHSSAADPTSWFQLLTMAGA
jgi:hypothetical protein